MKELPILTPENIFKKPHYRSILNILIKFQKYEFKGRTGIRPLQIRYALEKNYKLSKDSRVQRNIADLKIFFGEKLIYLEKNGLIQPDCITSKNNLSKFLKYLKYKVKAIQSEGTGKNIRYKIKDDFYNKHIRIQNKLALDLFTDNNLIDNTNINNREHPKQIIYGISQEIYDSLRPINQMHIKESLTKINKELNKIVEIKLKQFNIELEKRINDYLKKRNIGSTIREFLKKNPIKLWTVISNAFLFNNIHSKKDFFKTLGWIFKVPGENHEYQSKSHAIISKEDGDGLLEFIQGTPRGLNSNEIKKYVKSWSKNSFGKDYGFTLDEIRDLLEWGWDNKDLYYKYNPFTIAYSNYRDYEEFFKIKPNVSKNVK